MSIEKSVEKGEKKVGSEKQGVEKKKREERESTTSTPFSPRTF